MGKFCRFCGKQLQEGQLCDCRDTQASADMSAPQNSMTKETNIDLNSPSTEKPTPSTSNAQVPQGVQSYNAAPQGAQSYNSHPQGNQPYNAVPPQGGQAYNGVPNNQGYQQFQQNPYGNVQPGVTSAAISNSFGNVLQLFKAFVINPVDTMKSAFETPKKTDQFLTGGIAMLLIWLISFLIIKNPLMKSSDLFGRIFLFVLFYVFVRFLYIVGIYLFTKNKNPRVSISSLSGLMSISLILDCFLFVVLLLIRVLALFEFIPLALIVLFITTVVSAVAIANVATEGDFAQTFKMTLILQSVIVVVISILLSVIVRKILLGSMGRFGDIGDIGGLLDNLF